MSRTFVSSAVSVVSGTLVSRFLGFIKLFLLTVAIGTITNISDSFELANTLPNVIFIIIGGGIFNTVLVPQIVKASAGSEAAGNQYINKLLSISILCLLLTTALALAAAPFLVNLFSSSWSEDKIALTISFTIWCLPQIFFYGLYALLGQVLSARESYASYMWAPVMNNVIAIIGIVFFLLFFGSVADSDNDVENWSAIQTVILAGSATLGVATQASILVISLIRQGFKFSFILGFRGMGFRSVSFIAMWAFASVGLSQLLYFVTIRVATIPAGLRSELPPEESGVELAGNAAYGTAFLIFMLPHSVITVSIATILFTQMARAAKNLNYKKIKYDLLKSTRYVGVVIVFATAVLIVLSGMMGRIFSGGSVAAGAVIGQIIIAMAISIPFYSVNFLFQRVFYALEDAKTPFLAQLPVFVFSVVGNLLVTLLPARWIVFGVGVVLSLANILAMFITKILLSKKLGGIDFSYVFNVYIRLGYAALLCTLFGMVILSSLGGYDSSSLLWSNTVYAFLAIFIVAFCMLVSYLLFLKMFRIVELKEMLSPILSKLGRNVETNMDKDVLSDDLIEDFGDDTDTYYIQPGNGVDSMYTDTITIVLPKK